MLPVLMILPPPARFMAGYTALAIRNALVRFVSRTLVHSSRARSCGGLRMLIDARVVEQNARRSRSAQDRSGSGPHPDDGLAIPNGLGNLPENSMSVNLADLIGYSVVLAILVDSRPAALPWVVIIDD